MPEPESLETTASALLGQRVKATFGELQWNWMSAQAERDAALRRLAEVTVQLDETRARLAFFEAAAPNSEE